MLILKIINYQSEFNTCVLFLKMEDKFTELSKATQNLRKISIILKKKQIVIIKYIS